MSREWTCGCGNSNAESELHCDFCHAQQPCQGPWDCPLCTFRNSPDDLSCEMCGSIRPPVSALSPTTPAAPSSQGASHLSPPQGPSPALPGAAPPGLSSSTKRRRGLFEAGEQPTPGSAPRGSPATPGGSGVGKRQRLFEEEVGSTLSTPGMPAGGGTPGGSSGAGGTPVSPEVAEAAARFLRSSSFSSSGGPVKRSASASDPTPPPRRRRQRKGVLDPDFEKRWNTRVKPSGKVKKKKMKKEKKKKDEFDFDPSSDSDSESDSDSGSDSDSDSDTDSSSRPRPRLTKTKPTQSQAGKSPMPKYVPRRMPGWERQRLVKQQLPIEMHKLVKQTLPELFRPRPSPRWHDLYKELVGVYSFYWLRPLGSLLAAGHLQLMAEGEKGVSSTKVWIILYATRTLFTALELPLENGMPLQALMSRVKGGRGLGNAFTHKASSSWYRLGHDRFRHVGRRAGSGWGREEATVTAPSELVPCRFCFAPMGMHTDLSMDHDFAESDGVVPEYMINWWKEVLRGYTDREWLCSGRQPIVLQNVLDVPAVLERAKAHDIERREGVRKLQGLSVTLREYQWQAVEWWTEREKDHSKALIPSVKVNFAEPPGQSMTETGYFGTLLAQDDNPGFHYNNVTSELSLEGPCGVHGGVLASDMGMGKTVITAAAMVKNGFRAKGVPATDRGYSNGGTLVVVPAVLIKQWQRELRKICSGISIHLYHGMSRKRTAAELARFDVVLTTYQTATGNVERTRQPSPWGDPFQDPNQRMYQGEVYSRLDYVTMRLREMGYKCVNYTQGNILKRNYDNKPTPENRKALEEHNEIRGLMTRFSDDYYYSLPHVPQDKEVPNLRVSPLQRVKWHRMVCDEAHVCGAYIPTLMRVFARNRWMLSGTPFGPGSSEAELKNCVPIISCLHGSRANRFMTEFVSHHALEEYLSSFCLRHEKEDTYADGTPLLELPPKEEHEVTVELGFEERKVYERALEQYKEKLRPLLRTPGWYMAINLAAKRLRMLASHPTNIPSDVDPFQITFKDWRHNVQDGSGRWGERGDRKVLNDELLYLTLTELEMVLRANACGAELIKSITDRDFDRLPEECSICFEAMQLGTEQHPVCAVCGHMYCAACLSKMFANEGRTNNGNITCAQCRRVVSKREVFAIKPNSDASPSQPNPPPTQLPPEEDTAGWADLYASLRSRPSSKLQKVLESFKKVREEEPEAKFLFFCGFDPIQRELLKKLEENKVETRAIGGLSVNARARALHEFESNPDVSVLVVPIGVGAVGLNLTMANHIFIVDPPNNLTLLRQAIGRCWRMGQGRTVHVHKFVARDTIDVAMLEAARKQEAGHTSDSDGEDLEKGPEVVRMASWAAPRQSDGGRGVALLARKQLLEAFGFTEEDVYDRERDYQPGRRR
eukprot:Hpha_TRINITY_DN8434_c0_g1::TRINITY_DN8434_c0_g1_i1::g.34526::m.34526/K15505/RAD5; DNA repair protein RAD5